MDDKLKRFLNDEENHPETPMEEKAEAPKSKNKYDNFFGNDDESIFDKVQDGLGKAGEILKEGIKETSEFLGESFKETGRFFKEGSREAQKIVQDDLIPKAKEAKGKLDERVEGLTEKLKDYADKPIERTEGSGLDERIMDTHSSFFDKMERFAEKLENPPKPKERPATEITPVDTPVKQRDEGGKIHGFDDLDGDGDELIDDAIITE